MLKINVWSRKMSGSDLKKVFIPLVIWIVCTFASLFVTVAPFPEIISMIAVAIFVLNIVALIPLFIYLVWKADKLYKNSFYEEEICFEALGNEMYVDGQKVKVIYDSNEKSAYVSIGEKKNVRVDKPYSQKLLEYMEENNVCFETWDIEE